MAHTWQLTDALFAIEHFPTRGKKHMRALPFLLEPLLGILFLLLIITQIVVPACRGTKLFPFWRKRAKLKERLVELREESDTVDLEAAGWTVLVAIALAVFAHVMLYH